MKKHPHYRALIAVFCTSAALLCSCGTTGNNLSEKISASVTESDTGALSQEEAFDALMLEYFQESMNGSTMNANFTVKDLEKYGITREEATWGSVSLTEEDFKENQADILDYLDRLHAIGRPEGSRALTYDIFEYEMNCALEYYTEDYIYMENTLEPTLGFQSQIPTSMAEYHFNDVNDVEDYLVLLESLDEYVTDLMAYETDKAVAGYGMPRSALEKSIEECQAFIEDPNSNLLIDVFPDKLAEIEGLTDEEIKDYTARNEAAVKNDVTKAYEIMIDGMEAQLPTAPKNGSLSSYNKGKDYYRYLLRSSVGTDKTPEELITLTETKINNDIFSMALSMQLDPDLLEQISSTDFPYTDPGEIIEHYKKTMTAELMPKVPDAPYTLKEVPASLKDTLSPAMYFTPRIDDTNTNIIYMNIGGNGAGNELMPTMAHEAYPGHMYQFVYYYNTHPTPVRSVLSSLGYVEGWASYVETLSYAYCGFSENAAQFLMAYNDMTMNLYCRIDLGIHYEGWDEEATAAYIQQFIDVDQETVTDIYEIILYNPTNYLIYGIGMDEINLLKEDMQALYDTAAETGDTSKNAGSFDIVDFHKQFLDIGPAPFPIVRAYMLGE